MWAQYTKTFWPMQALILAVTLVIYFALTHVVMAALMFWVVMQGGAMIGAAWAFRLKNIINRNQNALPLHKRA